MSHHIIHSVIKMIFVYQSIERITKRSFAYRAASEYNELPYDLRQISSFTAFKSKLNNR